MCSRIKNNCSFIKLVLSSHRVQATALLETVSEKQADCISEIILNLYLGNLVHLTSKIKQILDSRKRIFKLLTNKNIKIKTRVETIKAHPRIILNTLKIVKKQIFELC